MMSGLMDSTFDYDLHYLNQRGRFRAVGHDVSHVKSDTEEEERELTKITASGTAWTSST